MSDQLGLLATRFAYASAQLPRTAWYAGLFYIMRQLARQAQLRESGGQPPQRGSNTELEQRLNADIAKLSARIARMWKLASILFHPMATAHSSLF
jgi:hypothetical protein